MVVVEAMSLTITSWLMRADLTIGARAAPVCWGVMPSEMLRHSLFVRQSASARLYASNSMSGQVERGALGEPTV